MKRIITLLLAFPIGLALIAIAVTNRQMVPLVLDPFRPDSPSTTVTLPLYVFLLGALLVGVMLGGFATWLGQSRWRRTAKAQGQRAARFEAEADRLTRERDKTIADRKSQQSLTLTAN